MMKRYLLVFLLALTAVAQEPPLVLDAPAAGDRVSVPCTLEQVLLTALKNSAVLETARLDPEIAATGIPEAKGAFDPAFSAAYTLQADHSAQTAANTSALRSPTGLGDVADALVDLDQVLDQLLAPRETVIRSEVDDVSVGIQQFFTTGTQVSVSGDVRGVATDAGTDDGYDAGLSVAVRQPLLRGAWRRIGTITIRQAQNQAQQSEQAFLATAITTMQQVELAYWDLVLSRELLAIREFGVTLAHEQLERSQARLNVGKGLEADVLAAQAEMATREADLGDARADLHAGSVALLELIKPEGRGAWAFDLQPGPAPEVQAEVLDEEASVDTALARRPELAQSRLEVDRQDLDVRLRRNELMPDLDVVALYGRRGEGGAHSSSLGGLNSSRLDNYSVGVEFQTSLSKRSEKARLQRAKLNAERAERGLRRDEDRVAAEVRQAVIGARKRWQRIEAVRKAVEARTQELEIEKGRNLAGKTTTLDVLQVQRDLLQAQTDEATARLGYLQALATLYAAEGTLLERRGVQVAPAEG